MDILIKNMEMPKSCDECELLYDFVYCIVTKQKMLDADFEKRNPSCPLVPVPEHGDLIDKQKLLKHGVEFSWSCQKWVDEVHIVTAPVVVEASK